MSAPPKAKAREVSPRRFTTRKQGIPSGSGLTCRAYPTTRDSVDFPPAAPPVRRWPPVPGGSAAPRRKCGQKRSSHPYILSVSRFPPASSRRRRTGPHRRRRRRRRGGGGRGRRRGSCRGRGRRGGGRRGHAVRRQRFKILDDPIHRCLHDFLLISGRVQQFHIVGVGHEPILDKDRRAVMHPAPGKRGSKRRAPSGCLSRSPFPPPAWRRSPRG